MEYCHILHATPKEKYFGVTTTIASKAVNNTVYCTIGWVNFSLFSNFMKRHIVYGSPRYNVENYQIV